MFEKEIRSIVDYNLNKVKRFGAFFTFEKINNSDLHPALILYISTQLDYLIYQDRRKLLNESAFDYTGAEVNKYFSLIGNELKKKKRISFEDAKNLIIQGVSFNINYIMRPKWSLVKLIFNTDEVKSCDEIKIMLNTIYYYEYLKNIVTGYINKKGVHSLSAVEFEMIISKIDKELFSLQDHDILFNAITTIAEFFNQGGGKVNQVPSAAVELFLKEKNLIDYLVRVRKESEKRGDNVLYVQEIQNIITSEEVAERKNIDPEKGEENSVDLDQRGLGEGDRDAEYEEATEGYELFDDEVEEDIEEVNIEEERDELKKEEQFRVSSGNNEKLEEEKDILSIMDEAIKSLDEEELGNELLEGDSFDQEDFSTLEDLEEFDDLDDLLENADITDDYDTRDKIKKDLKESDDFLIEEESRSEEAEEEDFSFLYEEDKEDPVKEEEKEKIKEKDSAREQSYNQSINQDRNIRKQRGKDIFTFLKSKETERIIMSIFNDDREDFTNSMERISECADYDEATTILKSIFLTYRINPYSKDAVVLTNAVSNYFDQD
jgi:hypothetical protein